MKNTTYRMKLDNGLRVTETAGSAAEAIEAARRKHRGHIVRECYSGMTHLDITEAQYLGLEPYHQPGTITYSVMDHEPIPEGAIIEARHRRVDRTISMFDDEVIKADSANARARFARA